jgi:cell division cycle protein 37
VKVDYETINSPASPACALPSLSPSEQPYSADPSSTQPTTTSATAAAESESEDEETPSLTPTLLSFSNLGTSLSSSADPAVIFQKSFEFIQGHPDVYVEGAVDALLIAAFEAQMKATRAETKGEKKEMRKEAKYALGCVHQGLLIQYCEKLGKDGVRVFFKKWVSRSVLPSLLLYTPPFPPPSAYLFAIPSSYFHSPDTRPKLIPPRTG